MDVNLREQVELALSQVVAGWRAWKSKPIRIEPKDKGFADLCSNRSIVLISNGLEVRQRRLRTILGPNCTQGSPTADSSAAIRCTSFVRSSSPHRRSPRRADHRKMRASHPAPGFPSHLDQHRCSCSNSGTSSHPTLSSDREALIQSSQRKLKGPRKRGHSTWPYERNGPAPATAMPGTSSRCSRKARGLPKGAAVGPPAWHCDARKYHAGARRRASRIPAGRAVLQLVWQTRWSVPCSAGIRRSPPRHYLRSATQSP